VWGGVAVALLAASQVGKVIVALATVRDDLGMSLTASGVLLSSYTFVGAGGWADTSAAVLTALVVFGNIVGNVSAGVLLHRGARPGTLIAVAAAIMGLGAVRPVLLRRSRFRVARWAPAGRGVRGCSHRRPGAA